MSDSGANGYGKDQNRRLKTPKLYKHKSDTLLFLKSIQYLSTAFRVKSKFLSVVCKILQDLAIPVSNTATLNL